MATDPRNTFQLQDIHAVPVTFKHDASIVYDKTVAGGAAQVGLAVTLVGQGQVGLVDTDQRVVGKLLAVESNGYCSVQIHGEVKLPGGNGATLTVGTAICGAQGAAAAKGYIKTAAAATLAQVAVQRGFIADSSVTTAVSVWLD